MNFRQLEYIQMIHKEGSISKAASRLFISQSALSQQLLKLEEELGAPIFERGFSPLKPTHFGEEYLRYVRKILFDYEEANHLLEKMEHSKKSRITIGIPFNRSTQFLPGFLPHFMKEYPNIELIFLEHPAYRLDGMIMDGEVDFSLLTSASRHPNMAFFPLIREEIFLAVQPGSRLDQKFASGNGYVDFKECADETFIMMDKGYRLYTEANRLFEQYDIQPRILLNTGNVDLARRLAANGTGICLASQLPAVLNPIFPAPKYYSIGKDGIFWTLGINYHKDKYLSWAIQIFFRCVQEELEGIFPNNVVTGS